MNDIEDDPLYLSPGSQVGAYIVRGYLGKGTGSLVFEVESGLGNRYALKLSRYTAGPPNSLSWEMDERFTRNIICLEQLRDVRWVARIVAHDRHPDPRSGRQYLVQELVPRPMFLAKPEKITDWAKRTSPSLRKLTKVFTQLAEACEDMRLAGIQNRDLKPDNILMTPDGEPRLIDFNSAIWHRAVTVTRPSAQAIPSTVAYLPPEVAMARLKELRTGREEPFVWTPGGDLYALGVVFYRILTGEHPFNLGVPEKELLQEIASVTPPRPMELQAVPFGLNKVVMRMLARDPEERYQEGDELVGDLEALMRVADASWDEPYQVPRMDRHEHGDGGGVPYVQVLNGKSSTAEPRSHETSHPVSPALTPTPEAAIVLADAAPKLALMPTPRRPRARRRLYAGAVAAVLLIGVGVALGVTSWSAPPPARPALPEPTVITIHVPSEPTPPPPVKKVQARTPKMAVLVAAAIPGFISPVIKADDDLDWLANCSTAARKTHATDEGPFLVQLRKGSNAIPYRGGWELKEGPVEVAATMGDASGLLVGRVLIGADRVHFRFHQFALPDGRKLPICAIGADSVPASESELHPGYRYITTGQFGVRLARH